MANETTAPGRTAPAGTVDERRTAAWVGKSLKIEGKVTSEEDLTIDGAVEGTIEVGGHSLMIGVGASVKADLVGKTINIGGAVVGNVTASETVEVQPTGSVEGDITALRLLLADGAVVAGRISAGRKAKSDAG